jgi:malonate transporter and related proteins
MIHAIVLALAPVFFVMVLGYAAGRFRIVDNRQVDGLNALVMSFALPASLFAATASASRSDTLGQAPLFVVLGGVMIVLYAIWYALMRTAFATSRADASLQALTIAFPNLAGVGLPILSAVLGPAGTIPIAVALAAGSILISPLTLFLVEMSRPRDGDRSEGATVRIVGVLRRALTKPVVLAPALGIAVSLLELKPGDIVEACLEQIGNAAAGVALFLTGLILSAQSFELDWKVVGATVMADIVRPLLTAAVAFLLPVPPEIAKTAVLISAVPSGFFGILFAVNYRLDTAAIGSMIIASTIASIATMAIAIAVLFPS